MYIEMRTYRVSEAGRGQVNLLFSEGPPNPRSATVLLGKIIVCYHRIYLSMTVSSLIMS